MINIVARRRGLGYMKVPAGVLIDISEIRQYRWDQLTLITTGSQGEADVGTLPHGVRGS